MLGMGKRMGCILLLLSGFCLAEETATDTEWKAIEGVWNAFAAAMVEGDEAVAKPFVAAHSDTAMFREMLPHMVATPQFRNVYAGRTIVDKKRSGQVALMILSRPGKRDIRYDPMLFLKEGDSWKLFPIDGKTSKDPAIAGDVTELVEWFEKRKKELSKAAR